MIADTAMLVRDIAHHFNFANVTMIDGSLPDVIVGVSATRRVSVTIELVNHQEVSCLKRATKLIQALCGMFANDLMDQRTRTGRHVHCDEEFHVDLQMSEGATRRPPPI